MPSLNHNFQKLKREIIFPIIDQKLLDLRQKNPTSKILNLGVGDIAKPIDTTIAKAISDATLEMTDPISIHGYGPSTGYSFLKDAIVDTEYQKYGITSEEIFISHGIISDITHIEELFSKENRLAIPNPAYPVYLDSNVMAGKTASLNKNDLFDGITTLQCTQENNFLPVPPKAPSDIIYLCSPHNPTGAAFSKSELQTWVDYARKNKAIILYDGAYEGFIRDSNIPKSIYEIDGSKDVAIEFRSFSKTAGFTGLRCSYTVIPQNINIDGIPVNSLWKTRQSTKFNGVAYPIQKGALASLSQVGQEASKRQIDDYLLQGKRIKEALLKKGFSVSGGDNSPYLWMKTPGSTTSWAFFDYLLEKFHIVTIPGVGFGKCGEGYIRLSSFITKETADEFLEKITAMEISCFHFAQES